MLINLALLAFWVVQACFMGSQDSPEYRSHWIAFCQKKKEKHVFAKKSFNLQKQAENQTKTSLHETEPDSFRFEDNN